MMIILMVQQIGTHGRLKVQEMLASYQHTKILINADGNIGIFYALDICSSYLYICISNLRGHQMIKCKFQDIEHAAKIVGNKTLPKIVFLLDNNTSYNCWGFTAYALQLVNKLYWM